MSTEGFEPSMLCIVSRPVPIRLMVNPGTISGMPESGYEPGFNSCKQDNSLGKPRGISPLESFADARPDLVGQSGLEPEILDSESRMIPFHHWPIL